MNLGDKLIELRKSKNLSQEEVAEQLNVTRQTVSKWETNQSTPDFDKIVPLCELFEISSEELLKGSRKEENNQDNSDIEYIKKKKRVLGLIIGIFLYFVSISWIITSVEYLKISEELAISIFLLIIGIATCTIIYTRIMYRDEKRALERKAEKQKKKIPNAISNVIGILFLVLYLVISFLTMAWHLTWLIWIIYGLVEEIINLIFTLKEDKNEK